ncbi:MAG: hypothetical protein ACREIV_09225, partial [Planctomycetaceae bacterium]
MIKPHLQLDGLHPLWWVVVCALAVLAAAALMVVLLRYERRLVPRKVGHSLLALRLLVLAALAAALLKPVWSWTRDRDQLGRIVVAIDLSESMSTSDAHASRAEKLRWARALG